MLGVVEIGEAEATAKCKLILGDSNAKSSREQLRWAFDALLKHCEVRFEYRAHECYLDNTWLEEKPETGESVKEEAVEKGSNKKKPKRKRHKRQDGNVLRWDRTFEKAFMKQTPRPISSFLSVGAPVV